MAYIAVSRSDPDGKGLGVRANKHKSDDPRIWLESPSMMFSVALDIDEAEKLLADLPAAIAEAKRLQAGAAA